ncbi:uncharacterized protein LOC132271408 [Cornus florida]|uniref:uncharacterized protein LOC132271408 n=1 Tax=Cornus florida TaxID=4283 RepID=UPI00289CD717|nr:uncharacterized protein LOC132271408 [Cornus florida]
MKQSIFMRVLFCKIHCPPFICFCKPSSAHLYTPGPLKLGNSPHVPSTVVSSVDDTSGAQISGETTEVKEESLDGKQESQRVLKSCIRKRIVELGGPKEAEKKRVQWMDNLGKELVEVKEFESSETGDTDNEEDNRGCVCIIL